MKIPAGRLLACAVLSVALPGALLDFPAKAAEEKSTVDVSLLDMVSIMNRGAGQRMIATDHLHGMMRRAPASVAPGTGPDGAVLGIGMTGRAMGMMSILVDRPTVRAGTVHFNVKNVSTLMRHEMLVIPVDGPDALLPYDYHTATVSEDTIRPAGAVGELGPGRADGLDLDLAAGSYLLICNIPGHYAAGMAALLTVTP